MSRLTASFSVIDSHTAGHPTRVILNGVPALRGADVREMRDDFRARFDHLRPSLLHEPRGHAAMVGLVLVPSAVADFGAFFISSYIYLDMCGHGTIGLAKTLAFSGQLAPLMGNSFTLETPAGVVTVDLSWSSDGELEAVRLRNVPSYVGLEDLRVQVDGIGEVRADIVYGGMWYALVDASSLGLTLAADNVSHLLDAGSRIKDAISEAVADMPLFGGSPSPSTLFYSADRPESATQFLVLESNKFDRSPCGTGTSARMTQLLHKGLLNTGETYHARNILGLDFKARMAGRATAGDRDAMVVEIEGNAFVTSMQTILFESGDPLSKGFLCR